MSSWRFPPAGNVDQAYAGAEDMTLVAVVGGGNLIRGGAGAVRVRLAEAVTLGVGIAGRRITAAREHVNFHGDYVGQLRGRAGGRGGAANENIRRAVAAVGCQDLVVGVRPYDRLRVIDRSARFADVVDAELNPERFDAIDHRKGCWLCEGAAREIYVRMHQGRN